MSDQDIDKIFSRFEKLREFVPYRQALSPSDVMIIVKDTLGVEWSSEFILLTLSDFRFEIVLVCMSQKKSFTEVMNEKKI